MDFQVDVWLRGTNHAATEVVAGIAREPAEWTDADVAAALRGMLLAMDRLKNPPGDPERNVTLQGFSWIVNPFEDGGVLIALEMTLGAAVAGPFDIDQARLDSMIARIVAAAIGERVH